MMTLEKLAEILEKERPQEGRLPVENDGSGPWVRPESKWGGLVNVDVFFYQDCREFLKQLETELSTAENYREMEMMKDQLRTANLVFEGIVNRRLAKITDQACIVADGATGPVISSNEKMMTPEERIAYDSIVYALKNVRNQVYGVGQIGEQKETAHRTDDGNIYNIA